MFAKQKTDYLYDLRVIVAVVVIPSSIFRHALLKLFINFITASSKRCNKVCEQFEQCMSKYQTGYFSFKVKNTPQGRQSMGENNAK